MEPKALFEIDLDRKARELETAKEILQEVFATSLAEVDEMIRLITAQRTYELNSKAVQASDEMLSIINNLRR